MRCPKCGSKDIETTCVGRIIGEGNPNTAFCKICGWAGPADDAEKASRLLSTTKEVWDIIIKPCYCAELICSRCEELLNLGKRELRNKEKEGT